MREFFRGWRRKVGVVTLAMACALAILWGRSLIYGDSVTVNRGTTTCDFIASFQGELKWLRTISPPPPPMGDFSSLGFLHPVPPRYSFSMKSRYLTDDETLMPVYGGIGIDWEWRLKGLGFQFGTGDVVGSKFWICLIPYWFVVLPLALLSAYLILVPSRKRVVQS
ncbi:MAG: hypothetical protein JWP89_3629 [Schlesneria sp.]|nr:hypothetical protein [Schlesneria sp.]